MHRVVALVSMVALALILSPWANAAPKTVETNAAEKGKKAHTTKVVLRCDPFALTKVLLKLAVNPRTKMLSAALEGMAVSLTKTGQRIVHLETPRTMVALASPAEEPLPTTFEPR
ncbi:MAG: L-lactate permease [Deltaproteobacteria bacterium]|nr:L-lactate permease [Deltaproteobacteria bacterium]